MSLTNFVDQLDAFPSLADSSAVATADALQWTDLEQNVVQSLQKACGMLSPELLQNPMIMVSSRLFVLPTGKKKSKNGRVYNLFQLLQL